MAELLVRGKKGLGGAHGRQDLQSFLDESFFFFQAEDGIRDADVTGVQTCALPISSESLDFGVKQLSQLWLANHSTSLLRWFNLNKPNELERLTSGMFSNNLGQNIFNQDRKSVV